jgi:coenzyme F420-reducing hydrogenase alpha subunit
MGRRENLLLLLAFNAMEKCMRVRVSAGNRGRRNVDVWIQQLADMTKKHTIHVICFQAPDWLRDMRCG